MTTINKKYSCQRQVKEQLLSSHRNYLGKAPFSDKVEYHVCGYMANKLKDVKIPKKKSVRRKEDAARVVESSSRYLHQLQRERQKDPIRLSQKVGSVKIVVDGRDHIEIDIMQHV
eukprot:7204407-Ditylum_brightwellii.AAC.1